MSTLAHIARQYGKALCDSKRSVMTSRHRFALRCISECRTPSMGQMQYACSPCEKEHLFFHSCGHRSCPQCQQRCHSLWLERQSRKLLPVSYYMITFTVPFEWRSFIFQHQKNAFNALFVTAQQTLNTFAKNDRHLGGCLGMTAVLHTHSRQLAFHPHIHVVVPAGVFNAKRTLWHTKSNNYLFNGKALAQVFRAKFTELMHQKFSSLPKDKGKNWVVQCKPVGRGASALKYLSRYLYRGVISDRQIIKLENNQVTFSYTDSQSKTTKYRTLPAVEFLWLALQHVLPKGFRRTRDYGFLHGNAAKTLKRLQLVLKVFLPPAIKQQPVKHLCPRCGELMKLTYLYSKNRRDKLRPA